MDVASRTMRHELYTAFVAVQVSPVRVFRKERRKVAKERKKAKGRERVTWVAFGVTREELGWGRSDKRYRDRSLIGSHSFGSMLVVRYHNFVAGVKAHEVVGAAPPR